MKKLLILVFTLVSLSAFSQSAPKQLTTSTFYKAINTGVVIVEFDASFAEPFADWADIEDCNYYRVDIEKYPDLKEDYKVRSVPSIYLFYNGEVEKKWRANIMLELDVEVDEIQEEIEELLGSRF